MVLAALEVADLSYSSQKKSILVAIYSAVLPFCDIVM